LKRERHHKEMHYFEVKAKHRLHDDRTRKANHRPLPGTVLPTDDQKQGGYNLKYTLTFGNDGCHFEFQDSEYWTARTDNSTAGGRMRDGKRCALKGKVHKNDNSHISTHICMRVACTGKGKRKTLRKTQQKI
jgi:hypothetical protein